MGNLVYGHHSRETTGTPKSVPISTYGTANLSSAPLSEATPLVRDTEAITPNQLNSPSNALQPSPQKGARNTAPTKKKRIYRAVEPIASDFVAVATDAIDLMLSCSRITVGNTNGARRIVLPNLRSVLERIELLCMQLTVNKQQGSSSHDPCVFVMCEQVLLALWNALARKYAESMSELEMAPPLFTAGRGTPWCCYSALHGQHMLEFRMMLQIVSLLNDCRSKNEYDLLMHAQFFSSRSMLVRQMARTNAAHEVIFASLSSFHDRRSDVDFHVSLQKMTTYGMERAASVKVNDILTHGDTVDGRAVPVINLAPMATSPFPSKSAQSLSATTSTTASAPLPTSPRRSNSHIAFSFNKSSSSKLLTNKPRTVSLPSMKPNTGTGAVENLSAAATLVSAALVVDAKS